MSHDWIFDVLNDLLSYSHRNGLTGLAHRVEHALDAARVDIAAARQRGAVDLQEPAGPHRCRH